MQVTTVIDGMVELIKKRKKATYLEIAKELSLDEDFVERIALILQKANLATTHYPANMLGRPWVTVVAAPLAEDATEDAKKLEEYEIPATRGHTTEFILIMQSKSERRPIYSIRRPGVSSYTRAYLEQLKIDIAKELPIETTSDDEGSSEKFFAKREIIKDRIKKDMALKPDALEMLSDIVVSEMYGLGELELLIGDPTKAKEKLGWTPKITFDELVAEMVREDLKAAERDELVKKHGYSVLNCHE